LYGIHGATCFCLYTYQLYLLFAIIQQNFMFPLLMKCGNTYHIDY